MATKQKSVVDAVREVFEALEPLDDETRARAIASAMSLLGMSPAATQFSSAPAQTAASPQPAQPQAPATPIHDRPQSLVELMQEKSPATNPQRIAVFAFYRERVQGLPRFSRRDLEAYFAEARVPPPANYDRDFNSAVQQGWIHEAADQSYLTTKGLEAVEAGFEGKRSGSTGAVRKKKASGRKKSTVRKTGRATGRKQRR